MEKNLEPETETGNVWWFIGIRGMKYVLSVIGEGIWDFLAKLMMRPFMN